MGIEGMALVPFNPDAEPGDEDDLELLGDEADFVPAQVVGEERYAALTTDPTLNGRLCGNAKRKSRVTGTIQGDPRILTCTRRAGHGTAHLGVGPCKYHGGGAVGLAQSTRHGARYQGALLKGRVVDLIQLFEEDPDPLNQLAELAAARALFADFINRHEVFSEALLGWWGSWDPLRKPLKDDQCEAFGNVVDEWESIAAGNPATTEQQLADLVLARAFVDAVRLRALSAPKPRTILDIGDAYRILSEISKIVERIEEIRAKNAISRADFVRLTTAMGNSVAKHVNDPEKLRKIRKEWLALQV